MKKKALISILIVLGVCLSILVVNIAMRFMRIQSVNYVFVYPTEDNILKQKDIEKVLTKQYGDFTQKQRREVSTEEVRAYLEQQNFILRADVAITLIGKLNITIYESEPLLRVYPLSGDSYYIDTEFNILTPVEGKPSHCMVASGLFPDKKSIQVKDSLRNIVHDAYELSLLIRQDSILKYQIDELVREDTTFMLIPKIGDYNIILGSKSQWPEELSKLHHLYKESFVYSDWNQYIKLDLRFKDEVVCTKKEKINKQK